MKSILLQADEDGGMEERLNAALCLASQFDCLVNCVQITAFDAFIMGDPFGGVYAMPEVAEQIGEAEKAHRLRIEDKLKRQRVRWEWQHFTGNAGHVLAQQSALADLAIVSLPARTARHSASLAAGVALHSRTPALALPIGSESFACEGDVVIAWDRSSEAAFALRCSVPLLKRAAGVHLLTIGRDMGEEWQADAAHYLLQHGIHVQRHVLAAGTHSTATLLLQHARSLGAHFLVAGATGHWRLRKALVGNVTAELIAKSELPLFLAH
jgi:nucleotide-binding universal stress UspA family protein